MVSVGVVGTGYWGKNLVRNFSELGVLSAIADTSATSLADVSRQFPLATTHHNPTTLIEDSGVDAVVIATPAVTHGMFARSALEAGKHVFVEKPLCLDVDEAVSLRNLAHKCGRTLMVGHLLHYHPAFRVVRAFVQTGEIGEIRYVYSNRLSLGKIRREENALWSFAPHDISMILSLTGDMPQYAHSHGAFHFSNRIADTSLSHLTFSNDVQAHVFVSWLHPYKEHRMVVVAEHGMIVFDDVQTGANKVRLFRHLIDCPDGAPTVNRGEPEFLPYEPAEPLRIECTAFLDAIQNGTIPPSNADEGIRVLRVLRACQDSIQSGQRVLI
jgi:UDP-2-acetamido-3-amino-2,3-dideoxy-glucuronate N-acetyltransferase